MVRTLGHASNGKELTYFKLVLTRRASCI